VPPWNDENVHHYHFTVYALSVPKLDLRQGVRRRGGDDGDEGQDARAGELAAIYTTIPTRRGGPEAITARQAKQTKGGLDCIKQKIPAHCRGFSLGYRTMR